MKNLIITIVGVGVVGGLAVAGYKMSSNPDSENPDNSVKDAPSEISVDKDVDKDKDNKDGNYYETMTNLMERGKSMKCTYTQKVDEEIANGIVYMADKNARIEITVSSGGKMYAIMDHDWHYSWTEGSSKGYKMTAEAAELDKKMKEKVSDLSKDIDFSCKPWKKDSSKFKTPSNIEFEDMSEMMAGLEDMPSQEEMEAEANKMICELCKNAPASEMEECLDGVVCD